MVGRLCYRFGYYIWDASNYLSNVAPNSAILGEELVYVSMLFRFLWLN